MRSKLQARFLGEGDGSNAIPLPGKARFETWRTNLTLPVSQGCHRIYFRRSPRREVTGHERRARKQRPGDDPRRPISRAFDEVMSIPLGKQGKCEKFRLERIANECTVSGRFV